MNQTSSRPASSAEISDALRVLFEAGLPFQRGVKVDGVALAYVEAMTGFPVESIHAGIRKFLRGECEDVSPRFVPTPPELARIVRTAVIPVRIPAARWIEPIRRDDGERARMRLKVPMFQYAFARGCMDLLAEANAQGFTAMAALATKWGIDIPEEFAGVQDDRIESDWRAARARAWNEIDRNPPPCIRAFERNQSQLAA